MTLDHEDLTRRAFAAWFRSGGTDQPSNVSGLETAEGLDYVVLRNVSGVLAVYRIRIVNGAPMLKRMKRWPAALDQ